MRTDISTKALNVTFITYPIGIVVSRGLDIQTKALMCENAPNFIGAHQNGALIASTSLPK
jgi:hypothetical protein